MGSLLAAFASWLSARHQGGTWRVRVEDVDPPRTVPGAAAAQLGLLRALGLAADGPVMWQSLRGDAYGLALERLMQGGHAFVCHCSRSDLAASGGIHRHCVPGQRRVDPAVRFRVPPGSTVTFHDALRGVQQQDVHAVVGDFVLRRADGCWAYQLAVVVDDAAQGVTEVVRGADLLESTARQILLQRALDLPTPAYRHLPLLLDPEGRKLSKSEGAGAADGGDPQATLRHLWALLGQPGAALAPSRDLPGLLQRAAQAFDPARVPPDDISARQAHAGP